MGVKVPDVRKLAKGYRDISVKEANQLLKSPIHEERLLALLILIHKFSKRNDPNRKSIYNLYLKNTRFVNNWDLVDASAEHIVGAFLMEKSKEPLYRLGKSKYLWERRISKYLLAKKCKN